MELLLQFGWGMMTHSRTLIDEWGEGTVILSPRDLNGDQLTRLSRDIDRAGGRCVLDPQFYLPHADHARLCSHSYWPQEFEPNHQLIPDEWERLLRDLDVLNEELGCREFLLPGILTGAPDSLDSWLEQHDTMLAEAQRTGILDKWTCWVTVAIGAEVAIQADACQRIIEWLEPWAVDGVYLVMERPAGRYLTENPSWLANALDLVGGLRLQKKKVLIGYANQQLLITAAAGATAIASGTWMNVRSFPPEKFRQVYDEEMRQRKTWFYAPRALSEYALSYLDLAQRHGLLDLMRRSPAEANRYSTPILAATQPSTTSFTEADAFRHYLWCMREQARMLTQSTFDGTLEAVRRLLADAEQAVGLLAEREIRDRAREFSPEVTQACLAALVSLESGLGPRLRREWEPV